MDLSLEKKMFNNLQNTNFGIKIIVSDLAYEKKPFSKLIEENKYINSPLTMQGAKFLGDEGFTDGAIICTAGFLKAKDGDEFFMFHLNPDNSENSWEKIKTGFLNAEKRLSCCGAKGLEGFLIGADSSDKYGMGKADYIIDFFQKTRVKFSALIGQIYMPWANLHYSLPKNEATVTFHNCESVKNIKGLKRFFSKVIEGNNDIFEFGEKDAQ